MSSSASRPEAFPGGVEAHHFVHSTSVVDAGARIGAGTKIWHFCHVCAGTQVGADCVLGQNVYLGPGVIVGRGCKIQNNVSLVQGVTLEEEVFVGPSAVFTNVLRPRAFLEQKQGFEATLVRRGATIGANATVLCGTTIGAYALIGSGTVVVDDVPAHALVVGNPARRIGWVDRSGRRTEEPPPAECV